MDRKGFQAVFMQVSLLLVLLYHVTGSETETAAPHTAAAPYNADDHPAGYWFGTQNLGCVMGISKRRKRGTWRVWRSTLSPNHRLVYYRGLMFEWGTGAETFNVGMHPAMPECHITWEDQPAGSSTCPISSMTSFTQTYAQKYGSYNVLTNNCHHYANRFADALSSSTCDAEPSVWAAMASSFWRRVAQQSQQGSLGRRTQKSGDADSHDIPIID